MPTLVYRRTLSVEWGQCDPLGIMFNRRFFEIFDQSSWRLFEAALGVKPHELGKKYGILGIPLVDVRASFQRPLKFGDDFEVASCVMEFRRSNFVIEHKIMLKGQQAAEGVETRVWARGDETTREMTALPVPSEVMARFETR